MKIKKITFSLFFSLIVLAGYGKKLSTTTTERPNIIIILIDDAGYEDFGFAGSPDLKTPNIDKLANSGIIFSDAHVTASVCGPSRAGIMTGRYQQRFGFECNPSGNFTGIQLTEKTIGNAMKNAGYTTAAFGKWHLGSGKQYRPNARGFDYFWGFLSGSRSYFPHPKQDQPENNCSIRENNNFTTFNGYLTDCLGKKAAEFIHNNKKNPFFIYWAPNAVHTPMEATAEDLNKFNNHPRKKLAAMTWALDRAVGTIIYQLKRDHLLDNTLIFFLSDNGGAFNNQSSNYPLKGFKGNKYEGGQRVPFFIFWPKKIKNNKIFNGLTSSLDIFATCIDAAGEKKSSYNLDGVSLLPYINREKTGNPHQHLFWRKDKMAAARECEYKIIRVDKLGFKLYNLNNDIHETIDLKNCNYTQFNKMKLQLTDWEKGLTTPLWTEGEEWDEVTWLIHQDLFNNKKVRIKTPGEMKKLHLNNTIPK